MELVRRGFKNVFRNSIRTFSVVIILGLSIGVALTMLMANKAVQSKITAVKETIGNTITVSPAGMRGFEGGGEPLTEAQAVKIASVGNIVSISKSLSDRLTSDNSSLESAVEAGSMGRRFSDSGSTDSSSSSTAGPTGESSGVPAGGFTPPVTVQGTTTPTNLSSSAGGGTFALESGVVFEADSTEREAIVGSSLAEANDLKVGSTFTAYDKKIEVVGIFDSGNDFSNNQVIMPLATLQVLTDQVGDLTSITATVDSISNIDTATTAIKDVLGDVADVTNSADQAKQSLEPLENIISISSISLYGAVGAGAVIILLTMIMIVRERRREIGILKAIGATNNKVMAQFMIEAITLTLLGSLVGLVIGVISSGSVTNMLVKSTATTTQVTTQMGPGMGRMRELAGAAGASIQNIQTTVGWEIIAYGLLVALAIAVLGSAVPALLISKIRPAEVMRTE